MKVDLYKTDGTVAGEQVELPEAIFGAKPNRHVVWMAVRAYLANQRQGTAMTKNRALVSGGGRKPWRQKGTGRARAGTIRSPLWRHGGRVFGPLPRDYSQDLPKKVKRLARISALSARFQDGRIRVVEDFSVTSGKTRDLYAILRNLGLTDRKVLLLTPEVDLMTYRAGRNIPNLIVRPAEQASTYDLLNCDVVLIQKSAVAQMERVLGS
ncbi:MAG: 50S ribosomal protein L4 [candidate division KSB1 bacterium]|nr:50S ribosomal protein L4 [candidate division KSB1 bacterium]